MERTLVIIKPNAVKNKQIGEIINHFEKQDFTIIGMKMLKLTKDEAENFFYIRRGQIDFESLITYMTSDNCLAFVLEGQDAVMKVREFTGNMDSKKANCSLINTDIEESIKNIWQNAIHVSETNETSKFEVNYFFPNYHGNFKKIIIK